ncbi:lipoprotein-anchoring transpeptidase ErfK/SrfK [Nakamurella sp. UYEF19]|uniref:L,D-transpeptidase n=1 Tax=Nakamurella sp. UYEF19 TaxID=1756392 RepID=UPI0033924C67
MTHQFRFAQIAAFLAVGAIALTACSGGSQSATVTVTVAATGPPTAIGPTSTAASALSPASSSPPATGTLARLTSPASSPAATTPVLPTADRPTISTVPTPRATGVSPITPIVVTATAGTLVDLSVTNPAGRLISGDYSTDEKTWTSSEPLAYDRKYSIDAVAATAAGRRSTLTTQFTTVKPAQTVFPSFFPNPKLTTVGIGQPMVVIFDKAPINRAAAEKTLTVTTVPAVKGSWYWWDNRTLHYRPQNYWTPGTKITVAAKVYGVNFGGGMYGEIDRTLNVTVGPAKIAKIDDATKKMQVYIDNKLVRTVPVSLGRNQTLDVNGKKISLVTPSGIYVAQEKYAVRQMSSATYGLPTSYDLGYDSKIPLAVRLSNGGIFIHSAPWSVADQGIRNVSHGCININPAAAQWFYNTFSYGDIVQVTGTSTTLAPTDGFSDWNIPWATWLQGSAL